MATRVPSVHLVKNCDSTRPGPSATSVANDELIEAGPDISFDTRDDVVIAIGPSLNSSGNRVTLQVVDGPLPKGRADTVENAVEQAVEKKWKSLDRKNRRLMFHVDERQARRRNFELNQHATGESWELDEDLDSI